MARRWKPTAASDDDIASDINKAGQQNSDVNFGVEKADYMDADASRPSFASPQRHEVGIRETTAREAKYLETLFEEWVQGDPNHTAALILLGVTLLAVALWHWIGWLFAPTWEKFCGIAALSCLISALYPWVSPLQNRLHAHRTTLKGRIEALAAQLGKMTVMPGQMATMIRQLDVMIDELVAQRRNLESMRDKTDWLPPKDKDKEKARRKA